MEAHFGQPSGVMNFEQFQNISADSFFEGIPVLPDSEMNEVLDNFNSQEFADLGNDLNYQAGLSPNNLMQQNITKTATGHLPAIDDYPGIYSFHIEIDDFEPHKNKWTYSAKLNKLYIRSEIVVKIPFKWDPNESNLFVRALPLYSDSQHMHKPVKRCYNHQNPLDTTNQGFAQHVEHILRTENVGAEYEKNLASERCSVVVPLADLQPGCSSVSIMYKFMCQTTCSGGMDRRPIMVIFTLERANGEVLGRQKLNVKICSCPKRDMDKEEKNSLEGSRCNKVVVKKENIPEVEPPAKRLKKEASETSTGHYLKLKFSNSKLCKSILKRVQEGLLRHSRDRNEVISREASELLIDVDNQLASFKK